MLHRAHYSHRRASRRGHPRRRNIRARCYPCFTFEELSETAAYVNARLQAAGAVRVHAPAPANRRYLLASIAAGGAAVNETIIQLAHPDLPFGGVGNSGLGKAHGHAGFLAFSNEKAVLRQRVGLTGIKPFYPPYTGRVRRLLGLAAEVFVGGRRPYL